MHTLYFNLLTGFSAPIKKGFPKLRIPEGFPINKY